MEVGYKKDLKHNYMLIEGDTDRKAEPFSIKMLEHQDIEGMLPVEQKLLDNRILYYYEITAKQSMVNILEKSLLSYDKVISICSGIIQTIERAYEYLLPEDDFILTPEYIYVDVITDIPSLCYFPGYNKYIKDQMSGFLEYLMNKVDYNDKDAVFLVYQLYAASKEEDYTFDHLTEVIQNCGKGQQSIGKSRLNKSGSYNNAHQSNFDEKAAPDIRENPNESVLPNNLLMDKPTVDYEKEVRMPPGRATAGEVKESIYPVIMEKVEGEAEAACYSVKTLLCAGACISGGVLVFFLCCVFKVIYNSFGNRIDYSKLFALSLILVCVEGYLLMKLLDKKNKITRMVKTQEYIDPREDYEHTSDNGVKNNGLKNNIKTLMNNRTVSKEKELLQAEPRPKIKDRNSYINNEYGKGRTEEIGIECYKTEGCRTGKSPLASENEDYTPTCLLNEMAEEPAFPILKALDEINYKNITISSFPFFIGKLKKNVDYCLEKDVVSRFHAKITKEGDRFFLTDLNSRNGTYINQELLQTYQKKEIKSGDEVAFANIKYKFCLS